MPSVPCLWQSSSLHRDLKGVEYVSVALMQGTAEVRYNPIWVAPEKIVEEVEDTGFDAKLLEVVEPTGSGMQAVRVQIEGMTCSACSSAVENVLLSLEGVKHAAVSLTLGEAEIEYDSSRVDASELVEAIDDAGFEAALLGRIDSSVTVISIKGMTCSACTSSVEKALKQVRAPLHQPGLHIPTGTAAASGGRGDGSAGACVVAIAGLGRD